MIITPLNDSTEGNASVAQHRAIRKHPIFRGHVAVEGHIVVGVDESNDDALLSDYSDKRLSMMMMLIWTTCKLELMVLLKLLLLMRTTRTISVVEIVKELKVAILDTDSDDNLFDADKEIKKWINSSDDDIELRTAN